MRFQQGNKMSRGGTKGNKGGRPSNQDREIKRLAGRYAKEYLEKRIDKVLGAYKKAALGVKRRKHHPKSGRIYWETEYDTANQRHWIDKFVPPMQKIEATGKDGRPLVPITIITPDMNASEDEVGE